MFNAVKTENVCESDLTSPQPSRMTQNDVSFLTSLASGGLAGTAVDVSLFPLDTIKTRLQSRQGFLAAGGFRNIYSGEISHCFPQNPQKDAKLNKKLFQVWARLL